MEQGLNLALRSSSANRLVFESDAYDVVTAGQTFHWLDPYWSIKGLYRVIRPGGFFFAVESKPVIPRGHPLAPFGFGFSDIDSVHKECDRHAQQYSGMLRLFATRPHMISLTCGWLFREPRSFDLTFARAYLFDSHVNQVLAGTPHPWQEMRRRFDEYVPSDGESCMYWLVLKFEKELSR